MSFMVGGATLGRPYPSPFRLCPPPPAGSLLLRSQPSISVTSGATAKIPPTCQERWSQSSVRGWETSVFETASGAAGIVWVPSVARNSGKSRRFFRSHIAATKVQAPPPSIHASSTSAGPWSTRGAAPIVLMGDQFQYKSNWFYGKTHFGNNAVALHLGDRDAWRVISCGWRKTTRTAEMNPLPQLGTGQDAAPDLQVHHPHCLKILVLCSGRSPPTQQYTIAEPRALCGLDSGW